MLKNLEKAGNPWGMPSRMRTEWTKDLDFPVPVLGEDVEDLSEVEYLFWVGCAGSLDDKAQKTTKAVAELLHIAGVKFAILGQGETCTGDPARRMGNEFVFQMLAHAERRDPQRGQGHQDRRDLPALLQHHRPGVPAARRQLRGRAPHAAAQRAGRRRASSRRSTAVEGSATYHDPCFLGRHNKVYSPPRELIAKVGGRSSSRRWNAPRSGPSAAAPAARGCGWKRPSASGSTTTAPKRRSPLNPDTIVTGCPFCKTMISDSVAGKQAAGDGPPST